MRVSVAVLLIVALLVWSAEAKPGRGGGHTTQGISSITPSSCSFTSGTTNGAVCTLAVTMSPASPPFSGTLALCTGTNTPVTGCSGANTGGFHLSGSIIEQSTGGSGTTAGVYSDVFAYAAQGSLTTIFQQLTLTGTAPGSQTIASIILDNTATTTGLSSGTLVGTLSVPLSAPTPTFPYAGTNLHLSTSGADSGGVCNGTNGAANGSFQITSAGILETNGSPTAGTKLICVAAAAAGVTASGQAFTITVGNLIDASTFCAGHGGGSGTQASPWTDRCIQFAVDAAVTGDTVFLAAGNWALHTGSGGDVPVTITKSINFIGAGSGNTFDAYGQALYSDITATATGTVTIAGTVMTVASSPAPTGTWVPGLLVTGSGITAGTVIASNGTGIGGAGTYNVLTSQTVSSPTVATAGGVHDLCPTAGGITCVATTGTNNTMGLGGYITFVGTSEFSGTDCTNVYVGHLYIDGSLKTASGGQWATLNSRTCPGPIVFDDIRLLTFGNTGISSESQFSPNETDNITVKHSVFAAPIDANPSSAGAFYSGVEALNWGQGNHGLFKNNLLFQAPFNPIYTDNVTFTGNVLVADFDGIAKYYQNPGFAIAGCSLTLTCGPNGGTTGSYSFFATNNYLYSSGQKLGTGGGVNDPGSGAAFAVSDLNWSGNWIIADSGSIAGCEWHIFGGNPMNCQSGHVFAGTNGMQVNGTGGPGTTSGGWAGGPCSTDPSGTCFNITNNSILSTTTAVLDATGNGVLPNSGPTPNHVNTTVNFNATQNYMVSSSNQYLHDSNSINPSVTGNFCVTSTFTQSDSSTCATTGFITLPTASFTLGPAYLSGADDYAPFATTAFTAQYGAVKWLASTSSTTPSSGGQTGTGCNGAACSWSFVPPVYLKGATHGQTVYLWTMDSVNNISSPASALIP